VSRVGCEGEDEDVDFERRRERGGWKGQRRSVERKRFTRVVDVQAATIGRVSTAVGIEGGTSDVSGGFDEGEREERPRKESQRGGRRVERL